jgi:hypothetical protein
MSSQGKFYEAKHFDLDFENDLALLELTKPLQEPISSLQLAKTIASPGDEVVMVGRAGHQQIAQAFPGRVVEYRKDIDVLF